MSGIPVVEDLQGLLKGQLEPGEEVVDSDRSRLTAPGENYGSIMLRLLIHIKNPITGTQRHLDTVAKVVPDSELVQKVFNTSITFRNEFKFYAQIVPLLDTYLKSKGISEGVDFTAPFYGGRLNMENTETVDKNAVLLMKNLKSQGYVIGKKTVGLDVESAKIVLDSLAKLHAAGLGFKRSNPEEFEHKIKPYFFSFVPSDDLTEKIYNTLVKYLEENGEFNKNEMELIKATYRQDSLKKNISDLWGTMIHYDSWTNNLLIKYVDNKPVHCVIVDFQVFEYGTPLNDVMFFLFSSIQQHLVLQNVDLLLDYYYRRLINNLQKLAIDTASFTKESFNDEVRKAVKYYEYYHSMWMLEPIMHDEFKSVDDINVLGGEKVFRWSQQHIDKIRSITRFCIEREWI